jgi:hypothetical protein
MSLDVYLDLEDAPKKEGGSGIYVRENGKVREISRAEWDERFPGMEPLVAGSDDAEEGLVYHDDITHNLNDMAKAAGIYKHLWRPDEVGVKLAADLIEPLRIGLEKLKADPEKYKQYNPDNGWGDYEDLVEFVENYLEACERYPQAAVRVWA